MKIEMLTLLSLIRVQNKGSFNNKIIFYLTMHLITSQYIVCGTIIMVVCRRPGPTHAYAGRGVAA